MDGIGSKIWIAEIKITNSDKLKAVASHEVFNQKME